MASVSNDPGGRKRLLFMAGDGRRKVIRLGKVSRKQAETVRGHVENLVAFALTGAAPPDETSRWVAALPDFLRKRLEAKGLVEARAPKPPPKPKLLLGVFLEGYLASRVDLKASTSVALGQCIRYLTEHFGAGKPIDTITPGDADEWRLFLVGKGLAEATIRRRSGAAKQFFKVAVRKGFLASNPFADIKAGNVANTARQYYVSPDVAQKVLDACPDAEWRLIFALCRYAGLRCPSELVGLRWGDIHLGGKSDPGRFTVHSPKTARHDGQATREVPIFPELLPHLQAAFDAAEPGAEYVIARYRLPNANLSTQLRRILWRAGIDPWPRLFQNLRASCDTDLAARFPAHVCARWLGHTPAIAAKHYLQVTEADFEAAAGHTLTKAAHYPNKAAQNAAQSGAVSSLPERESGTAEVQQRPVLPRDTELYTNLHIKQVGDTGLEPVTSCLSSRRSCQLS